MNLQQACLCRQQTNALPVLNLLPVSLLFVELVEVVDVWWMKASDVGILNTRGSSSALIGRFFLGPASVGLGCFVGRAASFVGVPV